MTLRQLEYLVAIAETGSFTLAAGRLHVSQPTLSQQIRTLELETGVQLIERLTRGVRLTPAGKAMYAEAQATLASARRAIENTRLVAAQEPQLLTLATVRSLAAAVLPVTIKRWRERHPEMSVRMLEFASRRQVAAAVREGRADLGIGPLPEEWAGARLELGWEQLVLVLPPDDPVAQTSGDLRLETLASRDWVLYEAGHGLGEQALAACRAAGFEPQPAVQTASVEVAARLAAAGIGPDQERARGSAAERPLDRPAGHLARVGLHGRGRVQPSRRRVRADPRRGPVAAALRRSALSRLRTRTAEPAAQRHSRATAASTVSSSRAAICTPIPPTGTTAQASRAMFIGATSRVSRPTTSELGTVRSGGGPGSAGSTSTLPGSTAACSAVPSSARRRRAAATSDGGRRSACA
jgi:DNA-binding transcriptional LysR family regulator